MRHLLCSAVVLAMLAPAGLARAADAATVFGGLFTDTCLAAFNDPGKVEAFMEARGLAALPDGIARNFLRGNSGKAWAIVLGEANYAVAQTDEGLCSVFARQAQAEAVTAEFERLLKHIPAPVQVAELESGGPNRNGTRTRSWGVNAPGSPNGVMFVLTTSTDPEASLQAMASMARVATREFKLLSAPDTP
ncbi:hypothetical protein [uncultured Stenotrophomonas sp.]|uniref:NMCC_0638 family (lipo)protein n=1 Tax=uncultured Stenotrophomonas sp. TaxID=165438 RepID=UPI0025E555E7|nr:hypothetical protein [uncultured Stenotrophomonas sp.]HDS1578839.1 hypothetical protein [Stenotrophomonas maltophilia]